MGYQKVGLNLAQIDTVPTAVLGELHVDQLGNHYRYMQADGAVTARNLYSYNPDTWQIDAPVDLTVTPADTQSVPICVWDQSTTDLADNEYAWVFVGPGSFQTITAEAITAKAICYGHATAGLIADTASALLLPGVTCMTGVGSATTGTFFATQPLYGTDLP